MAIPSNPDRSRIYSEFGSATRSANVSNRSLKDMYAQINGSGSGYSRDWFGGKGWCSISDASFDGAKESSSEIRLIFNLTSGGVDSFVFAQYYEDDGGKNFDDDAINGDLHVFASGGSKEIIVDGLEASTTYKLRLVYFNAFNDEWDDHKTEHTTSISRTTDIGTQYPQPSINDAVQDGSWIDVEWTYGDAPDSFSAQYRESTSHSWENMSLISSRNWGTSSNPKEGTWSPGRSFSGGQVRIRANGDGSADSSSWSDPYTIT